MGSVRSRIPTVSAAILALSLTICVGCRGTQHAHVLDDDDPDMVGSHTAGAETWKPLLAEAVDRLVARCPTSLRTVSFSESGTQAVTPETVCFVGVENRSAEELGDFKEQIYELIDSRISQHGRYRMISREYVQRAVHEIGCRPEDLVLPDRQRMLQAVLEKDSQPFDHILFARINSGTTRSNKHDYQRDYTMTLELLNIHTGESVKETADLRKGYHKSVLGRIRHYTD